MDFESGNVKTVYAGKKKLLTWGQSFVFQCDCKSMYEYHRAYPTVLKCRSCGQEYAFVYEEENGET